MRKTIGEFCRDAGLRKQSLFSPDFENAGFYRVQPGHRADWPLMHEWCKERFGPEFEFEVEPGAAVATRYGAVTLGGRIIKGREHYTWSGNDFYFDDEANAMWFKARWKADVTRWCGDYLWAIEMGEEGEEAFRRDMCDYFEIEIEEVWNGWAAISDDDAMVRARLIRPESDTIELTRFTHY